MDYLLKIKCSHNPKITKQIIELTIDHFDSKSKNNMLRLLTICQLNNIKLHFSGKIITNMLHDLNICYSNNDGVYLLYDKRYVKKHVTNQVFIDLLTINVPIWINNIGKRPKDFASTDYICSGTVWQALRYCYENGYDSDLGFKSLFYSVILKYSKSYIDMENIKIMEETSTILKNQDNYDYNILYIIGSYITQASSFISQLKNVK